MLLMHLHDDVYPEETALRRAAGRQPSEYTEEAFSLQSPGFSESDSLTPDRSAESTLLIPAEHRTRKTEHSLSENQKPQTETRRSFVARSLAAIAVVLLSVGGFLSLRDSGHTRPQPLMAAVEAERSESASTPQYLSKDIRDLQVMQDR